MTRVILFLSAGLFLIGCASGYRAEPLPADHPANPAAAEAPLPEPSSTLDRDALPPPPAEGGPEEDHDGHHMHPGSNTGDGT